MKKKIIVILVFTLFFTPVLAETSLGEKLKGRILLSVEENGEAWYINPNNLNRYYLGRPNDAFNILKNLGEGISNEDLNKIPVGLIDANEKDSDNDGLSDNLEIALGTDINKKDTDNDGYDDKDEIENNYDPVKKDLQQIDKEFTKKHLGKIFLQTEKNGEAWYIDPVSQKRYYLSRPNIAFEIMRQFGLGVKVKHLENIIKNKENEIPVTPTPPPVTINNGKDVIAKVVLAINNGDMENIKSFFTPEMGIIIEASLENMTDNNIFLFTDLLSGAKLISSNSSKLAYKSLVSFGEEYNEYFFDVEKQEDDSWLISKL